MSGQADGGGSHGTPVRPNTTMRSNPVKWWRQSLEWRGTESSGVSWCVDGPGLKWTGQTTVASTHTPTAALSCCGPDLRTDGRRPRIRQFEERITQQLTGQRVAPLGITLPILCNCRLRIGLVRE